MTVLIKVEWSEKPKWLLDISYQITSLLAFQLGSSGSLGKRFDGRKIVSKDLFLFSLSFDWIGLSAVSALASPCCILSAAETTAPPLLIQIEFAQSTQGKGTQLYIVNRADSAFLILHI